MKKLLFLLIFLTFLNAEGKNLDLDKATDEVLKLQTNKAAIGLAMKMAKWDREDKGKAFLLAKDVLYGDPNKLEYISIILIKEKKKKRPAFIAIKTAKGIKQEIKLTFVKRVGLKMKIVDEFKIPLFEEQDDFVVRLVGGNIKALKKDLLKLLLKNDFLFVTITKNNKEITKVFALFDFKEKYKKN